MEGGKIEETRKRKGFDDEEMGKRIKRNDKEEIEEGKRYGRGSKVNWEANTKILLQERNVKRTRFGKEKNGSKK